MMFETIPLFSLDIHKIQIKEWSEHKEKILSYMTNGYNDQTISFTDYFTYISEGEYPPYREEFLEIMSKYILEFQEHFNNISQEPYKFTRIAGPWCQKYNRYDYHPPHDHGSIGYSAVLYAKIEPEVHPSTQFFSPFPNHIGFRENRLIKVEEGDLVVFPANLMHMAPPHYSDEERIIISFNIQ